MSKKKIGIDIGHGESTFEKARSKFVNVNGKTYEEFHFNNAVAKQLKKRLEAHGFEVVMAQEVDDTDNYDESLKERSNFYDNKKVDIIFSIHANAGAKTGNGAGAFYWHTSKAGKQLADLYVKHWKNDIKGVKIYNTGAIASKPNSWTNFHMVRETDAPTILTENGFMTNDNDFQYIFGSKKAEYIKQVAEVHVKVACDYFKVAYKKEVPPAPKPAPAPSNVNVHTLKDGETFWSLSRKYNVTVKEIETANPKLKATALKVGTKVNIPSKVKFHTVVKGDSFWSLSQKYGVTTDALQKANPKVRPTAMTIGIKLVIPNK